LAVLAGNSELAFRCFVGTICEQRLVARAVELRTRIVGHAAVDRRVVDTAAAFRGADGVERDAGAAGERAAGLEHDPGRFAPAGTEAGDDRTGELLRCRQLFVARMADAEAAAEDDELRRPAVLFAAMTAELDEPVDSLEALVDARQLRADVNVNADGIEQPSRGGEGVERLRLV